MDTLFSDQSHSIFPQQFLALIGRNDSPLVIDVHPDARFAQSERTLLAARRCVPEEVAELAQDQTPQDVVVYCVHGHDVSAGAAAMPLYDALHAWCRSAQDERHNWRPETIRGVTQ